MIQDQRLDPEGAKFECFGGSLYAGASLRLLLGLDMGGRLQIIRDENGT